MSPKTDSQREESENDVSKLYGTYTLAFRSRNVEFTPVKRTTATAAEENVTPKKKRGVFKEDAYIFFTQIDTNITSALYNVCKSQ